MDPDGWSDAIAQSIRAVDFVLDRSHFEEQIVRTIENDSANNSSNGFETREPSRIADFSPVEHDT